MDSFVVDTNVAVVANGRCSPQASDSCVLACIEALAGVKERGLLVLDAGGIIFDEYLRHHSLSGQPGVGDAFVRWVFNHQFDPRRCERVEIHGLGESFAEFPEDSALAAFDPSDRKFVAVALASANQPTVLNAVDSDWWHHEADLARHGVTVQNLCPDARAGAAA